MNIETHQDPTGNMGIVQTYPSDLKIQVHFAHIHVLYMYVLNMVLIYSSTVANTVDQNR